MNKCVVAANLSPGDMFVNPETNRVERVTFVDHMDPHWVGIGVEFGSVVPLLASKPVKYKGRL